MSDWNEWRDPQNEDEFRRAYGMDDDEPPAVAGPFSTVGAVPYLTCRHGIVMSCPYCRAELDRR